MKRWRYWQYLDFNDIVQEVTKYLDKVDDVMKLLDGLMSPDQDQVRSTDQRHCDTLNACFFQSDEARVKIDEFVKKQSQEDALWRERSQLTAGCKTVTSRTVINNKEGEEERRKRKSEEIKELGNTAFRRGDYKQAEEYYTSALLEFDQNYLLFTNRAQTRLQLNKFQDAVNDCKEAIKLKQDNLKTIIIITKALRGMKDYQKALDMLEIAEKIPEVNMKIVEANRREIIAEMKVYMMKEKC